MKGKINMKAITKVSKLYNEFKDEFRETGLHNTLWQIIVNKHPSTRMKISFTLGYNNYTSLIVACNNGAKLQTTAIFKKGTSFDKALSICQTLNKRIFHQTIKQQQEIINQIPII